MTLWLILLLVWIAGIPVAFFLAAAVTAYVHERRRARLMPIVETRRTLGPSQCERRTRARSYGIRIRRPV